MHARVFGLLASALLVAGCGDTSHSVLAPAPGPASLPPNYSVEYDSLLQTPRFVRNSHSAEWFRPGAPGPYTNEQAFRILRDFVTKYATVFRFRPGTDGFVATWAEGHDGQNLVKVTQTYLGLEVEPMGYGTSVLPNGEVGSMIGRFLPNVHLLTTPLVTSERATRASIAALLPVVVTVYSAPRLVVTVADDTSTRLAWSTIVAGQGFLSWTVRVDAQSGKLLSVSPNWVTD